MKFFLAFLLFFAVSTLGTPPINLALAQDQTESSPNPELWGFKNQNSAKQKELIQPTLNFLKSSVTPELDKTEKSLSEEKLRSLFGKLKFLEELNKSNFLTASSKTYLGNSLTEILKRSPFFLPNNLKLDGEMYPFSASLRVQLLFTAFAFSKSIDNFSYIQTLNKSDAKRDNLWKKHQILVFDNSKYDETQLRFINSFLDSIPKRHQQPIILTCLECIFSQGPLYFFPPYFFVPPIISLEEFSQGNHINVFNIPLGKSFDLPLPEEFPFEPVDVFTGVFTHEYTHHVENNLSPELNEYKKLTRAVAGDKQQNYLRNMQEDGYFTANPGEFFASLANSFFADSNKIFNYSLTKAVQGNYNQINQFNLIASAYSESKFVNFYKTDREGNFSHNKIPIRKKGRIIQSLEVSKCKHSFQFQNRLINKVNSICEIDEEQKND